MSKDKKTPSKWKIHTWPKKVRKSYEETKKISPRKVSKPYWDKEWTERDKLAAKQASIDWEKWAEHNKELQLGEKKAVA